MANSTNSQTTKRPSISRWNFSIIQDGQEVASVEGPYETAKAYADHYALVCGQDGPVTVKETKIYD
jgi:hypothetical protein